MSDGGGGGARLWSEVVMWLVKNTFDLSELVNNLKKPIQKTLTIDQLGPIVCWG